MNRTLLDKARCMLAESKLPKRFWAEAIATSAYIANRSPKTSLNGLTPEHCWSGQKPDLSNMRVFGSKAFAYIPEQLRSKIEPKSNECIMLGYCLSQRGYRLWGPKNERIFAARDVIFHENRAEQPERPNITHLSVTEYFEEDHEPVVTLQETSEQPLTPLDEHSTLASNQEDQADQPTQREDSSESEADNSEDEQVNVQLRRATRP